MILTTDQIKLVVTVLKDRADADAQAGYTGCARDIREVVRLLEKASPGYGIAIVEHKCPHIYLKDPDLTLAPPTCIYCGHVRTQ